eukprot:11610173-Alexandrium_andersonii.AAC.1
MAVWDEPRPWNLRSVPLPLSPALALATNNLSSAESECGPLQTVLGLGRVEVRPVRASAALSTLA